MTAPIPAQRFNNWATYCGAQETIDGGKIELFTLTRDIPGHPEGSTIAMQTLLAAIGEEEANL